MDPHASFAAAGSSDEIDWRLLEEIFDDRNQWFQRQGLEYAQPNISSVAEPDNSPNLPRMFGHCESFLPMIARLVLTV